jgi:hypothetical protein
MPSKERAQAPFLTLTYTIIKASSIHDTQKRDWHSAEKEVSCVIALFVPACATVAAQEDAVILDHVDGFAYPDKIKAGQPITFYFRFDIMGLLKNMTNVIARSEATWLSRWHSISEIATSAKGGLAMTRTGLFQQTP